MQHNARYTLGFAASVAFVTSVMVAGAAVVLRPRQDANRILDRQRKVLDVAGLVESGDRVSPQEVIARFDAGIRPIVIELTTGQVDSSFESSSFEKSQPARDPGASRVAPSNAAGVSRLPRHAVVYHVFENGRLTSLVLPIEGQGLWATIYGFVALSPDLQRVTGITFYEHSETPGLGGEINTPAWRAKWRDRRPFDDRWQPRLEVVKGVAPSAADAPHLVDGLAGATLTGRAVTRIVQFWLGDDGFGPYLAEYRRGAGIS